MKQLGGLFPSLAEIFTSEALPDEGRLTPLSPPHTHLLLLLQVAFLL